MKESNINMELKIDFDVGDIQFIKRILNEELVFCMNAMLELRRYYGKTNEDYYHKAMDRYLTRKLKLQSILDKIDKGFENVRL